MAAGHLEVGQLVVAASSGPRIMTLTAPMGLRHPRYPLRGRTELLYQLQQQCEGRGDGRLHVLYGLSGSGKTAAALELAHRLQSRFGTAVGRCTWWIDARQAALFEGGLRSVARRVGVPEDLVNADEVVDVLWQRLSQADWPWLLVVDGVDDPSLLDGPGQLAAGTGWIRPHGCACGLVLVTTCDGTPDVWGAGAVLRPVLPLPEEDAAQVLFDHAGSGIGPVGGAVRLARRLGGLPLALRMAGDYLAEVNEMPEAFRDADMPAGFDAFVRALDGPVTHGLHPAPMIADMRRLALDLLERRGFGYAAALLELLSGFADAPVPYTLVLRTPLLRGHDGLEGIDGTAMWRTLRALAALSLVDLTPAPDAGAAAVQAASPATVRVHPLIRDLSSTSRYFPLVVTGLAYASDVAQAGKPEEPGTWAEWTVLAPHILYLVEQEAALATASEEVQVSAAAAAEMGARYLQARGLARQAEAVFTKVVQWRTRLLGASDSETLTAQHNLAAALHDLGEFAEAEALYQRVWQAHCAARGADFPHGLTARHELGRVLHDQGRLNEAEQHLSAVLKSQRRLHGDEHGHTLSARHELARVLHDLGRWEEARGEYEQVLRARQRTIGEDHPRTLTALHNLACLAQDEGLLEEAFEQFQGIHAARSRVLGTTHPQTLSTAYRLGCVLRDRGDALQASALLRQVHTALSSSLGEEHAQARRAAQTLRSLPPVAG
ncbi:tetratricopeptide repeat protein [Streptomyces griseoaurantiacus]|uniref:tetratricopeptide repeat protein n=1 Tax=Streptomyces griseoaurantiacus TaxID=68213 RepID=UPI0034616902